MNSFVCNKDNGFKGNTTELSDEVFLEIDFDAVETIKNLFVQYDLSCASGFDKTMPATAYFVGATIGALFIPPLSDIYGRRKVFLYACVVSIFMFALQLVLPYNGTDQNMLSFYLIGTTMFINGIVSASRKSIGFMYIVELAPSKFRATLGTLWNTSELSMTNIYITTYFWFINKNWIGTAYIAEFLVTISFLFTWAFIPESPKWLYVKERYSDLRAVLIYMARTNGKKVDDDAQIHKLGPHLDDGLGELELDSDDEVDEMEDSIPEAKSERGSELE